MEKSSKSGVYIVLGILAAIVSIGAGLYLWSWQSTSTDLGGGQDVFIIIMHGMGGYFIARGAWMLAQIAK